MWINPAQVRSLMYLSTLVNEVMRAMADVERAWEAAAAHQTTVWPFPQLSRNAGGKYTRQVPCLLRHLEVQEQDAAAHQTTVGPFPQLSRTAGGKHTR